MNKDCPEGNIGNRDVRSVFFFLFSLSGKCPGTMGGRGMLQEFTTNASHTGLIIPIHWLKELRQNHKTAMMHSPRKSSGK